MGQVWLRDRVEGWLSAPQAVCMPGSVVYPETGPAIVWIPVLILRILIARIFREAKGHLRRWVAHVYFHVAEALRQHRNHIRIRKEAFDMRVIHYSTCKLTATLLRAARNQSSWHTELTHYNTQHNTENQSTQR